MRREDLSDAEILLTDYFGFSDIITASGIEMVLLYRLMIEKSFMNEDKSVYSKALRLAWRHIQSGKYRRTLEFDNIILNQIRKGKLDKIEQYAR